jgi:8-oxo-dGTP pyrophosphatase MutT (NUDIX family)
MTQQRLRPRVRDPKAVPVSGTDHHLPAVDPAELTPEAVKRRFATAPDWTPEFTGDGRAFEREFRPASVLVPLVQRDDGLHVLLTQRTDHLHDHAGQISFPGGRADEGDVDEVDTALRETEEEIGLARRHIEVIGRLPIYTTITCYHVTPVVALVHPPFELALDAFEVAEAFEVPLQFLMTPAHHRRHLFEYEGDQRHFLSMPWRAPTPAGEREYFIWGATAAMLRNLYRFVAR